MQFICIFENAVSGCMCLQESAELQPPVLLENPLGAGEEKAPLHC